MELEIVTQEMLKENEENCEIIEGAKIEVLPPIYKLDTWFHCPLRLNVKNMDDLMCSSEPVEYMVPKEVKLFGTNKKKSTFSLGKFSIRDGKLFVDLGEKEVALCNFCLELVGRKKIYMMKSAVKVLYMFKVILPKSQKYFEIPISEVRNLYKSLIKEIPAATMYSFTSKSETYFDEYVAELIGAYDGDLQETDEYHLSGWFKKDDKFHFYSDADSNCTSTRKLASVDEYDPRLVIASAVEFLNIATRDVSVPVFVMMHAAYLYKLFSDAGVPMQFIFDLIGPTGSRKTSLAKVAFTLFDRSLRADNIVNFTATERSMELIAEKNRDGFVILDDLSNVTNKDHLKKFEQFLRQVCDQVGRKRSTNGGQELDSVDIQFATIITAESYFDELDVSSKLRNTPVFLQKESINNDVLKVFQDDRRNAINNDSSSVLERYMTLFIRYIEENYDRVVRMIANFEVERNTNIQRARLEETRKVFHIMIHLIHSAMNYYGYYTDHNAILREISDWSAIVDSMVLENQYLCDETEPYLLYIRALRAVIRNDTLRIAPDKETFVRAFSGGFYDGFFDKADTLKLLPDEVFKQISKYYTSTKVTFNRSRKEIEDKLIAEGICEGYKIASRKKPRTYKSVVVLGESVDFLVFNIHKLWNVEEATVQRVNLDSI